MKQQMDQVLNKAYQAGASDIHITVGRPPMMRVRGEMIPIEGFPALTSEHTTKLIFGIINENLQAEFKEKLELDCSYFIPNVCRFRVNVMSQKGVTEAVLRVIPSKIRYQPPRR
jgi:twitching motility protein PilT